MLSFFVVFSGLCLFFVACLLLSVACDVVCVLYVWLCLCVVFVLF